MRIRRGRTEQDPYSEAPRPTSGGGGKRRWIRTLVLAALVALGFIYLGDTLGIQRSEIVRNLLATLELLIAIVLVGSVLGALLGYLRSKLSGRSRPRR